MRYWRSHVVWSVRSWLLTDQTTVVLEFSFSVWLINGVDPDEQKEVNSPEVRWASCVNESKKVFKSHLSLREFTNLDLCTHGNLNSSIHVYDGRGEEKMQSLLSPPFYFLFFFLRVLRHNLSQCLGSVRRACWESGLIWHEATNWPSSCSKNGGEASWVRGGREYSESINTPFSLSAPVIYTVLHENCEAAIEGWRTDSARYCEWKIENIGIIYIALSILLSGRWNGMCGYFGSWIILISFELYMR